MNDETMYLVPKELALASGYSAKTIRRFLREGVLDGFKPGKRKNGQWRIPRCNLRYFLQCIEERRTARAEKSPVPPIKCTRPLFK